MKSQQIAVIFIIIILPIALVMGFSIGKQIDTLKLQTDYTTSLTNATYDAVRAFQINTVNNRYSSISSSKIRDIEASINTFFISLSDNEPLTEEQLKMCTPSLVYTLYDGYYIYSKYNNVYPTNDGQILTKAQQLGRDANFGLKPYIYYSCRYRTQNGTKDFVVNYTLDNAITVYGNLGNGYETKSGYLIAPELVQIDRFNENTPLNWQLTYDGVVVTPEELTEHLLFVDKTEGDYNYVVYNGQKVYYDPNAKRIEENSAEAIQGGEKPTTEYFYYQDYAKAYIPNYKKTNGEIIGYLDKRVNNKKLYSTSSFEYYYNAKQFSEYIIDKIGNITQREAVELDGNNNFVNIEFSLNTENEKIFNVSKNNNPLFSNSAFDENRKAVIRRSIETNLTAAIANYNMYSTNTYEFKLPVLNEIEWDKITNNVTVVSFLQGIPIGYKYYNNYCVVTNNDNEEVVKKENIFVITEDDGIREYHLPGCEHLLEMKKRPTTLGSLQDISVFNAQATAQTQLPIQILGDENIEPGKTKTLTIRLNSNEKIGIISGTIKNNNLLNNITMKTIENNGWEITYNQSKGTFKAMKAEGATQEDVFQIQYTAGDTQGQGTVTLSNLDLTNIQYETKRYADVIKEIPIMQTQLPIQILGDEKIEQGETKTLTVRLNSNEEIGVISGKITNNNLLKNITIKTIENNGWEITYNQSNGTFKAIKAEGAIQEDVFQIQYMAGDTTGQGVITLSNLDLTDMEYKTKNYANVTKNIAVVEENESYEMVKKYNIAGAYANTSFLRQTVRISEGNYLYFYPLTRRENPYLTTCYYCMVNATSVFNVEDILKGEIIIKDDERTIKINSKNNGNFKAIREAYIRALGRERNHLYQVNMDTFN